MARRSSNTQNTAEVTETEATEAPAEETTATTPEAPAEETPIDLTAFQAAVDAAVAEADSSTGDVPKAAIDAVNKVYRELDGLKPKNAARASLDVQMKAAISEEKNIQKAKSFVMIKDGLSAGGGSSAPKAPADPTQAFVQKVVALRLATDEVMSTVPEGVSEDWTEKAQELSDSLAEDIAKYREYLGSEDSDAEAPEVSPVVRQVFKLVQGRSTGGGGGTRVAGGPRRDIEKHLIQVFADEEPGAFLTVNEIAKRASTEYGDDRPSAGAVSARLFPKGKAPYEANGIKGVNEEDKPRGAVKL